MSRQRLPLALSISALVVAVFGSTPLGQAAVTKIVPFAKNAAFAKNAHTVDGIHASVSPKPGMLIPLNETAKVPQAVLPAAAPPKVVHGWARYRTGAINAIGDIAQLDIPDANVIVRAKASFSNSYWSGSSASMNCSLLVGSESDTVTFGVPAYGSGPVVIPFEVAAHRGGARTAFLRCNSSSTYGPYVSASSIRMSAVEVDDLTNQQE